jgi:hypothetical protein
MNAARVRRLARYNRNRNQPDIIIKPSRAMKSLTLTVHIPKSKLFTIRYLLGLRVIQFGAWIIGIGTTNVDVK